jgi:hypothetical protein
MGVDVEIVRPSFPGPRHATSGRHNRLASTAIIIAIYFELIRSYACFSEKCHCVVVKSNSDPRDMPEMRRTARSSDCPVEEVTRMGTAPAFASVDEAMEMARAALGYLAAADATALAAVTQAEALRTLEQIEAITTAARASFLAAFTVGKGFSADVD